MDQAVFEGRQKVNNFDELVTLVRATPVGVEVGVDFPAPPQGTRLDTCLMAMDLMDKNLGVSIYQPNLVKLPGYMVLKREPEES